MISSIDVYKEILNLIKTGIYEIPSANILPNDKGLNTFSKNPESRPGGYS